MNSKFTKECFKSTLSHICPSFEKSLSKTAHVFLKSFFKRRAFLLKNRTRKEKKELLGNDNPTNLWGSTLGNYMVIWDVFVNSSFFHTCI